jgi:shikimate 5-dehydrogenase
VEWYLDEAGSFADKTVVLVGVGGVGEPMAKAIAKQTPAELILVDPNDKNYLVDQSREKVINSSYYSSVSELPEINASGNVVLINAAGKEGATDNSGIAALLSKLASSDNVFVDIRPLLEIEVVETAKELGWQAYTGYGMNARNDYVLLNGIGRYAGLTPPSFEAFQKLVAAAS